MHMSQVNVDKHYNLQCVCYIYPGIFSCRHSGTYLFTYSVNTFVSAYQLVVRLVLEGVNESDAISDPVHTGQVIKIHL